MAQAIPQNPPAALPGDEFASVAVSELDAEPVFRESGLHREHVERLVSLRGHWPPILVGRRDGRVIDGAHRVAAARILGLARIDATFFDGGPEEALIEFVHRNVHHGLPLTLRERKRAVGRVLSAHPEWSDRRIAELCGVSPKTVGRLRPQARGGPTEEGTQLDTALRIGRDNRARPVNSALLRSRVADAIEQQPDASLRTIAASVGVSPETVRRVRMKAGQPPAAKSAGAARRRKPAQADPRFEEIPLASHQEEAGAFASWWDRTRVVEDDWPRRLGELPSERLDEIATEARRRSEVWAGFARRLDQRKRELRK